MTHPEDGANDPAREEADSGDLAPEAADFSALRPDMLFDLELERDAWLDLAACLRKASRTGRISKLRAAVLAVVLEEVINGYLPAFWLLGIEQLKMRPGRDIWGQSFHVKIGKLSPFAFPCGIMSPYVRGLAYIIMVKELGLPDRAPVKRVVEALGIEKRTWMNVRKRHLREAQKLAERFLNSGTQGMAIIKYLARHDPEKGLKLLWAWVTYHRSPTDQLASRDTGSEGSRSLDVEDDMAGEAPEDRNGGAPAEGRRAREGLDHTET